MSHIPPPILGILVHIDTLTDKVLCSAPLKTLLAYRRFTAALTPAFHLLEMMIQKRLVAVRVLLLQNRPLVCNIHRSVRKPPNTSVVHTTCWISRLRSC